MDIINCENCGEAMMKSQPHCGFCRMVNLPNAEAEHDRKLVYNTRHADIKKHEDEILIPRERIKRKMMFCARHRKEAQELGEGNYQIVPFAMDCLICGDYYKRKIKHIR